MYPYLSTHLIIGKTKAIGNPARVQPDARINPSDIQTNHLILVQMLIK